MTNIRYGQEDVLWVLFYVTFFSGGPASTFCQDRLWFFSGYALFAATIWSLIMGFVILNTAFVNLRMEKTSSLVISGKILVKVCHQVGHKRQLRFCPTGSDHQYGWDVGLPGHCHSKITLSSFQNIFLFNIWCTFFWRPCVTGELSWIFSSKRL